MHTEDVPYSHAGAELTGFLAYDETAAGPRPGVLVVHDAGGLGEHIKEKARRLAGLGYTAFALDLYGSAPASMVMSSTSAMEWSRNFTSSVSRL